MERLDAAWALSALGGYDAARALIEVLDCDVSELTDAAFEGIQSLAEEGEYPGLLVERGDDDAVALLQKVLRRTSDVALQEVTVEVTNAGMTLELRKSEGESLDPVISGIELVAEGL